MCSERSTSMFRHVNIRPLQTLITIAALIVIELPDTVTCFNVYTPLVHHSIPQSNIIHFTASSSTRLAATESISDDISRQLAKAKELLELSKAKLAAQEEAGDSKDAVEQKKPIVLKSSEIDEKRLKVTKSTDDESGLITTDGELMAMLSEEEDWEARDMFDVFEDELEESEVSKQLAKRDVAASIVGMRIRSVYICYILKNYIFALERGTEVSSCFILLQQFIITQLLLCNAKTNNSMHNDDYKKIFNTRNRFIGEY